MPRSLPPLQGLASRAMRCIAATLVVTCLSSATAFAGPGHAGDKGHAHDGPSAASAQSPRIVATSEAFQIVGILKGGKLTVYLDREPDNVPVTDAKITLSADGKATELAATKDGTYEIAAGDWAKPGENEMQFSIAASGKSDLLGGVLIVPGSTGAASTAATALHASGLRAHLPPLRQLIWGALLLGLGLIGGNLLARRRTATVASATLLALTVITYGHSAFAGPGHAGDEGHSHGPAAGAGLSDAASRLPDGSVFLPKPTQRLIEVRTGLVTASEARRHVRLPGRVIATANGSVIEVALYDQTDPDAIRAAQAVAPSGVKTEIKLSGRGAELKLNALPLTFSLPASAPPALKSVGQRVTVVLETGEPIKGIVLPRAAVVTAPNGQSVVFEHVEPEKFTPKQVLFSALDTERVIVTSGLGDGEKVVLQAASLINQVR